MKVFINENELTITEGMTLEQALQLWKTTFSDPSMSNSQFAIAVNECFTPKNVYEQTILNDGDRIELLVPMQGG